MPKKVEEHMSSEEFDLFDHRGEIIAAFRDGKKTIVLNGRKFDLRLKTLSNVEYVIVSPDKGLAPCANLILSETKFREEMERRGTPLPDRKPLHKKA